MQILLGPFCEGSSLWMAEVKAILISVRFSTPFSLNTFGELLTIASAGLLIARADELCGAFSREFEVLGEFVKF